MSVFSTPREQSCPSSTNQRSQDTKPIRHAATALAAMSTAQAETTERDHAATAEERPTCPCTSAPGAR